MAGQPACGTGVWNAGGRGIRRPAGGVGEAADGSAMCLSAVTGWGLSGAWGSSAGLVVDAVSLLGVDKLVDSILGGWGASQTKIEK